MCSICTGAYFVMDNMYKLMQLLKAEGVMLCFTGPFSQQLLVSIVNSIRVSIGQEQETPSLTDKVFSSVVELTQNIIKYEPEGNESEFNELIFSEGIVTVGKENNDNYYVFSVNAIDNDTAEVVLNYINELINASKDELKKLYFKKIREDRKNDRSAGVGLITIARSSCMPIQCELMKANDKYSYLFIKAVFG